MRAVLVVGLVVLAVACSSGEETSAPDAGGASGGGAAGSPLCIPGASVACVGPGACQGGQVCEADGASFRPCDCGASGASGASAGAAGTAGAGGQGGELGGAAGDGAGGAGASGGAGAGGCVPKTTAKARGASTCGPAPDGCGGEVTCGDCPAWLVCEGGEAKQCGGKCAPGATPLPCPPDYPQGISCPSTAGYEPDPNECKKVDLGVKTPGLFCCKAP